MFWSFIFLGSVILYGLSLHHVMSTGTFAEEESIYEKTIVYKMYSKILSPVKSKQLCVRRGKYCDYNDHMGCKHFKTMKKGKVVCGYGNHTSMDDFVEEPSSNEMVKTSIDEFASLIRKHGILTFDGRLVKHLNLKSKLLNKYISVLERHKILRTHMDPVDGMQLIWIAKDNGSNGKTGNPDSQQPGYKGCLEKYNGYFADCLEKYNGYFAGKAPTPAMTVDTTPEYMEIQYFN